MAGLFDFENRRLGTDLPPFFPDVDSRFKFCALVFGGEERRFDETECAFFMHDTQTVNDPDRCFPLAAEDFARVNPNTGTAPVFRTRRDAEITRRIYEQHPVLVDRSEGGERRAWPVKYIRMFDMTATISDLFRTAEQLQEDGIYPASRQSLAETLPGQPEHRHRSGLPHPARRRNHPPYLRRQSWWTARKVVHAALGRFDTIGNLI